MGKLLKAHNDGNLDASLVRSKSDQSGMIPWSLRRFRSLGSEFYGGASVSSGPSRSVVPFWTNLGFDGAVTLVCPAATIGTLAKATFPKLYGKRFGLLLLGASSNTFINGGPMDVFVDRKRYVSTDNWSRAHGAISTGDGTFYLPVCDDLPDDGPHTIDVTLWPDASQATTVTILAIMVEERMGYSRGLPVLQDETGVTLTTSNQQIGSGAQSLVRSLRYVNTDTSAAHTVVVTNQAGDVYDTFTLAAATAASGPTPLIPTKYDLVFPDRLSIVNWNHRIDTAPGNGSVKALALIGG